MNEQEQLFREIYEEAYLNFLKDKSDYNFGSVMALEDVAIQVYKMDIQKFEDNLFKKFEKGIDTTICMC